MFTKFEKETWKSFQKQHKDVYKSNILNIWLLIISLFQAKSQTEKYFCSAMV